MESHTIQIHTEFISVRKENRVKIKAAVTITDAAKTTYLANKPHPVRQPEKTTAFSRFV